MSLTISCAKDTIEALKPSAVIAGHKRAENDDSPRIIEDTRRYIRDFDRVAGTTTTAGELFDKILEIYPDRIHPGALWSSAREGSPHFYSHVVCGRYEIARTSEQAPEECSRAQFPCGRHQTCRIARRLKLAGRLD